MTKLSAAYTMATDKNGRDWLVLVAKGTYGFPSESTVEPTLLEDQVPLFTSDEFGGDPAHSAPRFENDFALRKPHCDVIIVGSCHAREAFRQRRFLSASVSGAFQSRST